MFLRLFLWKIMMFVKHNSLMSTSTLLSFCSVKYLACELLIWNEIMWFILKLRKHEYKLFSLQQLHIEDITMQTVSDSDKYLKLPKKSTFFLFLCSVNFLLSSADLCGSVCISVFMFGSAAVLCSGSSFLADTHFSFFRWYIDRHLLSLWLWRKVSLSFLAWFHNKSSQILNLKVLFFHFYFRCERSVILPFAIVELYSFKATT